MTQKEIDKFLACTKVYVNGKSKEIQEKLFSLGYEWIEGDTDVIFTECPFLYINENHRIEYGTDMCVFTEHEHREITAEEILSLKLTEPKYRPFKTQEECWNEMLKHQPFGWIKSASKHINIIGLSETDVELSPDEVDMDFDIVKNSISFNYMFQSFTFADGTPFGIKED